jgi:putative flippase GtrA
MAWSLQAFARDVGVYSIVGTVGTIINLGVVAVTVPIGMAPLAANVVGFLISFGWCFFGHSRWTFPAKERDVGVALRRFAIISLLSFGLTEAAYAAVLTWTSVDYRLGLLLVVQALAVGKLLASKFWAFAR